VGTQAEIVVEGRHISKCILIFFGIKLEQCFGSCIVSETAAQMDAKWLNKFSSKMEES
jgi:hypothetical protein